MGASGALHTNERFLFSCLSEWVMVSPSERQCRVWVPGGMTVHEPPTSTGPILVDLSSAPAPVLPSASSTLRAWSRKPMKSRELRIVTEDVGMETRKTKSRVVTINSRKLSGGVEHLRSTLNKYILELQPVLIYKWGNEEISNYVSWPITELNNCETLPVTNCPGRYDEADVRRVMWLCRGSCGWARMWPGIISLQEVELAPRENETVEGASDNKTMPTPKQWRVDFISTHFKAEEDKVHILHMAYTSV